MVIKYLFYLLFILTITSCSNSKLAQEIVTLPNGSTDVVTYKVVTDSLKIGYYSNGNIYYKGISFAGFDGYNELESIQYNNDGSVNKYAYYLNDSLRYYRFYNTDGSVRDCGGFGLVYLEDETKYTDSLNINQKFFQQLRAIKPPHCLTRIYSGKEIENESDRNFDTDPLNLLPIKKNLSGFLVDYSKPGIYNNVIYWSIEDTISGNVQKGRVWRKFIVSDN
ncbi:MAG: hypothetical protein JXB17_12525 [Bacteroidales bacterium]|nr:hypothetical protein [Bacteroidales bacterium]